MSRHRHAFNRRELLVRLGVSAAALPFVTNLPGVARAAGSPATAGRKRRMVIFFTPNGIVPKDFWPDAEGPLDKLKACLEPLTPFRDQILTLHGVCDKVRGDGDAHMRGMGCLLTGVELFPGNIQGGSDTPAGWAKGHSIDQEIKNHLHKDPSTRTRFGSLEFGVMVPERADTWTRMVYTGANKPVAPLDNPYQMFNKLYGQAKDRAAVASVLDGVSKDLKTLSGKLGSEDRRLLQEHAELVREMEKEIREQQAVEGGKAGHPVPQLEPGVRADNDQMPKLSRMQIDLMVASMMADFARVFSFQYTNSVGMARMRWLGITEGHHELSHEPDSNTGAMDKLVKINNWFSGEIAYFLKRLKETPEPGGPGSLLDNTLVVWTNELGKGSSHTLDDIPFVLMGGGLDFKMGRALKYKKVPHNRLMMALAHGFGNELKSFGNPNFCGDGPLTGLRG
jgi:hypothetical protein